VPDDVREAILEKWLTYAKSENLTEWQMWRLLLMRKGLDLMEQTALKLVLNEKRKRDEKAVDYKDKNGKYSTNVKTYSQTLNKIYPLLDPDITRAKRITKHATWHKD